MSEGEEPHAKFEFYGRIGTRELLLIHRNPWRLELFGPEPAGMRLLRSAEPNTPGVRSESVGLTFSLSGDADRPDLVAQDPDGSAWTIN